MCQYVYVYRLTARTTLALLVCPLTPLGYKSNDNPSLECEYVYREQVLFVR